jgi:hypothetical protein
MTKSTRPDEYGKTCTRCTEYRLNGEFYRNKATSDGLQSWCKPCTIAYVNGKARASDPNGTRFRYQAAHRNVYVTRGRASGQTCGCGAPAEEWAYQHTGVQEWPSVLGPFSLDASQYEAMCRKCHRRMDQGIVRGRRG